MGHYMPRPLYILYSGIRLLCRSNLPADSAETATDRVQDEIYNIYAVNADHIPRSTQRSREYIHTYVHNNIMINTALLRG